MPKKDYTLKRQDKPFLPPEIKGRLLMLCGALNDIAEKSKETYTKSQIECVQIQIESILLNN